MTIAVAPLGFHSSPTFARTSSALSWMLASIVRRRFSPGSVGLVSFISMASPSASLTRPSLAVVAAQLLVERVLEPRQAPAVGADGAEQLRGHPLARVDARELGDELEPFDLELLDLARPVGGHVAREVGEPGVAARELAQELVLGLVDHAGEPGGEAGRLLDQVRRRGDRHRRLGDGQLGAAAVGDGAAPGGHDQIRLLLGGRGGLERAGLDDAEPGGLAGADDEQSQEDREEQSDAALDQLH